MKKLQKPSRNKLAEKRKQHWRRTDEHIERTQETLAPQHHTDQLVTCPQNHLSLRVTDARNTIVDSTCPLVFRLESMDCPDLVPCTTSCSHHHQSAHHSFFGRDLFCWGPLHIDNRQLRDFDIHTMWSHHAAHLLL